MSFVKNLLGGTVIMIAATVVGVGVNAVRGDGVSLFARIERQAVQPREASRPAVDEIEPLRDPEAADGTVDASPFVTATEFEGAEISKERVRAIIDLGTIEAGGVILVDARSADLYAESHLPGAISIPTDNFYEYDIAGLVPMGADVIIYCNSVTCDLAERLAQEMRLMEYQRIVIYKGGWDEWSEAGYAVE